MLWSDGWNAVEAHDAEELVEMTLTLAPQVLLVDGEMRDATVWEWLTVAQHHGLPTRLLVRGSLF
jgi:hypothetical protein